MKCYHTGLPMNMCGHCSGTSATIADPFKGGRSRDKMGESTGAYGTHAAREAVVEGSLYTHRPRSAWARENMLRTTIDLGITVQAVGMIKPDFDKVIAAMRDETPRALPAVARIVTDVRNGVVVASHQKTSGVGRNKRVQFEGAPPIQAPARPPKQNVARAKNPNLRIQQFYTRSRT